MCVKVLKQSNNSVFIYEANVLSNFTHRCLPFLFGVCVGSRPSIVTSFHGIGNRSITIHHALSCKVKELVVDWMKIVSEVLSGLQHLHNKHKILHNDLKTDNIVLKPAPLADNTIAGAVIIDFGKACEISKGRMYNLSHTQRERYRLNHPHVAPDLRDGQCAQSESSDVYAIGRIISIVCDRSRDRFLQLDTLKDLSHKCTQYHKHQRPDLTYVQTCVNDIIIKKI